MSSVGLKTSQQILAELDALRTNRMEIAFVVDDNLIGNKVGIETPHEASLRETKKFQNVRAGKTLVEKVHAIQAAGLEVWCGLIVGFDSDDGGIFERQQEFVEQTRISHAMLGMLSAIPKTPLYERLSREDRLDRAEESTYGTNVIPLGMSREDLRNGYIDLQHRLHEPEAYFDRLDRLFLDARFQFAQPRAAYLRRRPLRRIRANTIDACRALGAFTRLMLTVPDPALRRVYGRRFQRMLRARREPQVWMVYAIKCVIHYHHYTMSRQMTPESTRLVNTF